MGALLRLTKGLNQSDSDRPTIRKDADVNNPTVGPILGYTTDEQARIFLRGAPNNNYPVFAAVRHRKTGDSHWSAGVYSKLSAQYDMSEILVLHGLNPGTQYEYQAGWFTTTLFSHTAEAVKHMPLDWPAAVYAFKTASPERKRVQRYVVGSCRYLRLTLGVPSAPEKGDKIFSAISKLASSYPLDGLLMVGDQVYVDDLNIVAPDREYASITLKYRTAFSQPHIRDLMAGTPTYMILDDHEIEDNWPSNKGRNDHALYDNAIRAYEIYQSSHGPAHNLLPSGHINRKINHYWYSFADGDTDWFVLDCRTQRSHTDMIDHEQEAALLSWLARSTAKVKFIVSSVLIFPDQIRRGDDGWKAYAAQRQRILDSIRTRKIPNVMFVSGDIHGSLTCRLSHNEDPDFVTHSIVSSPLCNSKLLPYANAENLSLDKPLPTSGSSAYQPTLTSAVVTEDNFACLTVEAQHLLVDFRNKEGRLVETVTIALK